MTSNLQRDYVVLSEIDRGRYGVVYKCASRSNPSQMFALKTIDKFALSSAVNPLAAQCLSTEVNIVQLLNPHPNIVALHNVYEDHATLHIIFELCEPPNLFDRLTTGPNGMAIFSEGRASCIMRQLMQAVSHCHRHGVAHRDIKPENVLFAGGKLKLADFGLAEYFNNGQLIRGVVGSAYYVAPEILAKTEYDEKVDVWSSGVILYVMLSGTVPFDGDSEDEILDAVRRCNLVFPEECFQNVSPKAMDLIRRMICRDVRRRLSAEEVLRHSWFNMFEEETI